MNIAINIIVALYGSEELGDVFAGGREVPIAQADFPLIVENRNPFESRQNDRDESARTADLKIDLRTILITML